MTGSLGDIFIESAKIALSYIKSNYKKFKIDYDLLLNNDIHIHVPEGAIKKDGPSAGVAITTAIISALTNIKVSSAITMTGEITLRGNILPVGGLKEKILGAKRKCVHKIYLPSDNKNDIDEIEDYIKEGLHFYYLTNYIELYEEIFQKKKK
jgi:ATP-dependent Lon protease